MIRKSLFILYVIIFLLGLSNTVASQTLFKKGTKDPQEKEIPTLTKPAEKLFASITLLTPNGNENWTIDSIQYIKWKAEGLEGNVQLFLLKDNIVLGEISQKNISVSSGMYPWKVGLYIKDGKIEKAPSGSGYKIRIALGNLKDESDIPFTLSLNIQSQKETRPVKQISVIFPNGGEKLIMGQKTTIRWSGFDISEGYSIVLLKGSQELGLIADNLDQNQTSFEWKIGAPLIDGKNYVIGDDYKIIVRSKTGDIKDSSDQVFSITETKSISPKVGETIVPSGSIRLVYPNGGETFYTGDQINIRYETEGSFEKIYVYLWDKSEGRNFQADFKGPFSPTGQILYQIPDIIASGYPLNRTFSLQIRGYILGNIYVEDEVDSLFIIGRGFDITPKIKEVKFRKKRGVDWDTWIDVVSDLAGPWQIGKDVTALGIKVKFEIKNEGNFWPSLPISIPWQVILQKAGTNAGLVKGYSSIREVGGVALGEAVFEIPVDLDKESLGLKLIVNIDPEHIHEKLDSFWRNNQVEQMYIIPRKLD